MRIIKRTIRAKRDDGRTFSRTLDFIRLIPNVEGEVRRGEDDRGNQDGSILVTFFEKRGNLRTVAEVMSFDPESWELSTTELERMAKKLVEIVEKESVGIEGSDWEWNDETAKAVVRGETVYLTQKPYHRIKEGDRIFFLNTLDDEPGRMVKLLRVHNDGLWYYFYETSDIQSFAVLKAPGSFFVERTDGIYRKHMSISEIHEKLMQREQDADFDPPILVKIEGEDTAYRPIKGLTLQPFFGEVEDRLDDEKDALDHNEEPEEPSFSFFYEEAFKLSSDPFRTSFFVLDVTNDIERKIEEDGYDISDYVDGGSLQNKYYLELRAVDNEPAELMSKERGRIHKASVDGEEEKLLAGALLVKDNYGDEETEITKVEFDPMVKGVYKLTLTQAYDDEVKATPNFEIVINVLKVKDLEKITPRTESIRFVMEAIDGITVLEGDDFYTDDDGEVISDKEIEKRMGI